MLYSNNCPMRRVPLAIVEEVNQELNRMEKEGILSKIDSSPWVSNMVIVRKDHGKGGIRICADFRQLNKAIVPDKYPLPTVDELSEHFAGCRYFTKIDLKWGYLQVPLAEEAKPLTAMITPQGLYQWNRLPFGIFSAPSFFQKVVAMVIQGIPGVKNLLDDIGICGKTLEEHDSRLRKVLKRLDDYNISINTDKSVFGVGEMNYVGHNISGQGVQRLQSNIQAVLEIPEPTNLKELQRFLGAANYYHKFIPHYSDLTIPMRILLKSNSEWNFNDKCKNAFSNIKQALTNSPV